MENDKDKPDKPLPHADMDWDALRAYVDEICISAGLDCIPAEEWPRTTPAQTPKKK